MQSQNNVDNDKKVKRKSGYLDIKLPLNSRSRRQVKAWRKRWVDFQICNDKILLQVFISESAVSKQEPPLYKKELSNQIIFFRSESKSHPHTFSVAEREEVVLHFSASSETESQSWIKTLRDMIWPPNQILELENNLAGVHQVSIIDNELCQRAGLLGAYGYMKITDTKIILINPCMGHVIQEWYLNTLCRFQLLPANHKNDREKIFSFETGSNSSTGKGTLYFYSENAVSILKSIGCIIQSILEKNKTNAQTKSERDQYMKDLEELEQCMNESRKEAEQEAEEYYQVPRREIRSVLDIPNFTFDRPLSSSSLDLELCRKEKKKLEVRHSCPEMNQYPNVRTERKINLHIPDESNDIDESLEKRYSNRETLHDLTRISQ
ncbi:uncharacterized protein [Centruroides vittatus]|uniref:uncharacterized protein isoform X1 n=1 Tax=Centruroides vittatus TaxID=120091 RepID=UPI0035107926